MSISPGTKLGRYAIRSQLGAGGMGEVYVARDTKLERTVALKILPANVAEDRQRMKRFVQEAKAASALNHPNILTIYEIEQIDSIPVISTELIDGETLRQHLSIRQIDTAETLEISVQIASALSAAHAAGIIHRDIKPDNIMLRRDGIVKVLDFGLAKLTAIVNSDEDTDPEAPTKIVVQTEPGVVMGTTPYMSPEQARGKEVDTRTDIFSLGAVIYELLSGRQPFVGETAADIVAALIEKEPQPLSTLVPNSPAELQHIVNKALRKDRDERYQTVKGLLVDLKTLKQELDFNAKLARISSADSKEGAAQTSAQANAPMKAAYTKANIARPTSTIRDVISRINTPFVRVAVVVVLVAALAVGYWYYNHISSTATPVQTIAVLPFVNESGNADVEYLSDGMTETLISSLSRLPNLLVKARSTVFTYKGRSLKPQQIASELSVQAILNGRFVQRGDDITLYLSLVDGRTGDQIWGEQYNRRLKDVLALQSDIARDVSQKLRARLSGTDEQKVAKSYTANPEAYQLYLKGRYEALKLKPADTQKAQLYFQQAIQIDPSYALAYVGLAHVYTGFSLSGEMRPTEFWPKAKAGTQKALEIDDELAEAHAELGWVTFFFDWDWNTAEYQCKRALDLNPNSAESYVAYAHLLSNMGRHAEALTEGERAIELDPLNLRINALQAQFLIHAGQTDEALARLQKIFELDANFWFAHLFAASADIEKGRYSEAIAEARKAKELSPTQTISVGFEGYALAKSGKRAEAQARVDELLKLATQRYVPPYHMALIYNGLGERDKTLDWLERGYNERDPKMTFLKVEPKWNNLRNDPRFEDLMRRVGFNQ